MSSITATALPNNGSVSLEITKTSTVTKVVRTNTNGIEEVRAAAGQLPSPAGGTELRRNLISNPSAETNITGFQTELGTGGAVSNSRPTTGGAVGTAFYRATWTTGNTGGSAGPAHLQGGLTGLLTESYSASAWVRSSVARTVTLDITLILAGTPHTYRGGAPTALVPNVWTQVKVGAILPTQNFDQVYIWAYSGDLFPTGSTMDMDGVLFEATYGVGTYFDGDTADTEEYAYTWEGTPHASQSTQRQEDVLILSDYEAAHGLNTYNAYFEDGSFVTTSVTMDFDKPWLSVPVMPQYSEQVETVTQFSANREATTTIHRPLGRADALVVMGKLGTRTGTMEIFCREYADARKLERVFERGEIVQLRQRVEGMDMYFTVTGIPVSPYAVNGEDATRWAMNINYIEVRRPIGTLAGALGWTFDALAADIPSFDEVTDVFDDFDALTLGDANV